MDNNMQLQPPPKIEFDDGQRIIHTKVANTQTNNDNDNGIIITTSYNNEYYEIESIITQIKSYMESKPNPSRILNIALQFPIHTIYKDSYRICNIISSKLEDELICVDDNNAQGDIIDDVLVFIVGDNNFDSSCCDNIVSAQHLSADILIHFGHACFSSTIGKHEGIVSDNTTLCNTNGNNNSNMPVVLYAGKLNLNLSSFITQVKDVIVATTNNNDDDDKKLLIFYESVYHHILNDIKQSLASTYPNESIVFAQLSSHFNHNDVNKDDQKVVSIGSYKVIVPKNDNFSNYDILYISSKPYNPNVNYSHLRNIYPELCTILVSTSTGPNSSTTCYVCHNENNNDCVIREQSISPIYKFISRRYYQIEKTKLSNIIGIVIHSYHIPNLYQQVLQLANSINSSSNKIAYIVVVGKMTITKLANFAEMDAFIIMGCPEMTISALLQETIGIDDFDFHVPIITPYEWTFILNNSNNKNDDYIWDGSYSLDSNVIMNRLEQCKDISKNKNTDINDKINDDDSSNDEPYYSLISGKYESSSSCACNNQLIKNQTSNTTTIMEYKKYDANEFLKLREYRGALPSIDHDYDEALDVVHGAIEGKRGIASEYTATTCCKDSI